MLWFVPSLIEFSMKKLSICVFFINLAHCGLKEGIFYNKPEASFKYQNSLFPMNCIYFPQGGVHILHRQDNLLLWPFPPEMCCCFFSIHNYHVADHKSLLNSTILVTFYSCLCWKSTISQIGTVVSMYIGYSCNFLTKCQIKGF